MSRDMSDISSVGSVSRLSTIAAELRGRIVEYSGKSKTPHLGSCLSCVDILTAYYFDVLRIDPARPSDPDRDRFILSKGHAAPALFQVLAMAGFFPEADLWESDHHGGSLFGEHPPAPGHLPGIEAATGSLGHGLPLAVGMALAARLEGKKHRIDVLMGDGECNEGSVWEAAMLASGQRLGQITVVVDFNKWQATDRSCDVMGLESLSAKWRAFQWDAVEVDGHDINALLHALKRPFSDRPLAVIAHTVKGKGVSFMEDDNNWHYRTPNPAEVEQAKRELGLIQ